MLRAIQSKKTVVKTSQFCYNGFINLKRSLMKISPYTIIQLKDGNYFFVHSVGSRRVEIGALKDKIVRGIVIKKSKVILEGKTTKEVLNVKEATFKEIEQFFFDQDLYDQEWFYVEEIAKVVKRKSIEFSIPEVEFI